jgi:hypothetical protein
MGNGVIYIYIYIYNNCSLIEVTVPAGISWNNTGRRLRANFEGVRND